jgi:hypothetical protein
MKISVLFISVVTVKEFHSESGEIQYTANILTVLRTAFGSVTFPTVMWLYIVQSKKLFNLKLYSSMSVSVIYTAIGCNNHCQITVGNVTQPMTVNWL